MPRRSKQARSLVSRSLSHVCYGTVLNSDLRPTCSVFHIFKCKPRMRHESRSLRPCLPSRQGNNTNDQWRRRCPLPPDTHVAPGPVSKSWSAVHMTPIPSVCVTPHAVFRMWLSTRAALCGFLGRVACLCAVKVADVGCGKSHSVCGQLNG